jgi:hypothetical protein
MSEDIIRKTEEMLAFNHKAYSIIAGVFFLIEGINKDERRSFDDKIRALDEILNWMQLFIKDVEHGRI